MCYVFFYCSDESGLDEHGNPLHDGRCALKLVNKREYWDR